MITLPNICNGHPGNPYRRGRLSAVDLRVLTNVDQLLLIKQTLSTFFYKYGNLLTRSTVLSLPFQWVFPGNSNHADSLKSNVDAQTTYDPTYLISCEKNSWTLPDACIIKCFAAIINSVLLKASVFVQGSKKGSTIAKILAYYATEFIMALKFLWYEPQASIDS
jgi:hypothetical protein